MFVYNLKLNKNSLFKIIIGTLSIICISLMITALYKIFSTANDSNQDKCLPQKGIALIDDKNYTNILKMVYEDIETYIGQEISFTGYVYRVSDIKENEFILARDMIISDSPKQTVVVGFLATCSNSQIYENGAWVNVTGSIQKGYYLEEIPILKISEIKRTSRPENADVPAPDDYYIPTSVIY